MIKTGKAETKEHYQAILQVVKDQNKEKEKSHTAQTELYSISDQIKLLGEIEKEAIFDVKRRRRDSKPSSSKPSSSFQRRS